MKNRKNKSFIKIRSSHSFNSTKRNMSAYTEKKIGSAGHVYVFSLGFDDLYKVGRTTNLKSRQKELQAGNPKLRFVWSAYTKNCLKLEKILHKALEKYWVERELFRFTSYEIILKINKIADEYNFQP